MLTIIFLFCCAWIALGIVAGVLYALYMLIDMIFLLIWRVTHDGKDFYSDLYTF